MAAKEESESASQEGDQRIVDLALQAVYKGTGAMVRVGTEKVAKMAKMGVKGREEPMAVAQKEAKGK